MAKTRAMPKRETLPLAKLVCDPKNANKGTERGKKLLAESLAQYGAGRSILIDSKGRVIAGNKTLEQARAAGHQDVLIVKSDGSKLVAVQRTDLDLNDPKAKALAIADNRIGELDLSWDVDALAEIGKSVDLAQFWESDELNKLLSAPVTEGDASGASEKALNHGYGVMIENISEQQQLTLLERLTEEGLL